MKIDWKICLIFAVIWTLCCLVFALTSPSVEKENTSYHWGENFDLPRFVEVVPEVKTLGPEVKKVVGPHKSVLLMVPTAQKMKADSLDYSVIVNRGYVSVAEISDRPASVKLAENYRVLKVDTVSVEGGMRYTLFGEGIKITALFNQNYKSFKFNKLNLSI